MNMIMMILSIIDDYVYVNMILCVLLLYYCHYHYYYLLSSSPCITLLTLLLRFGLTMRSPLEVHSPLMPGQSVSTSILLLTTGAVVTRGDTLQIALKNNVSVFYFSTPVPLHVLFVEDAAVDRNDYLRMWREIPDHLENRAEVSGLRANNVAAFKHKLQLNNVFTVAEREADGRQILYCFARTLPDRASFFVEVSFNLGAHAALSALRTTATHLAAPFQATLAAILRHAQ